MPEDLLQKYRNVELPLPRKNLVWEMYGAGLENFGKDGRPAVKDLPEPAPDELLLRTDAVGICFSDVKLTSQGPEHPRITGRDLIRHPVVPGHEVAATVVKVGENLTRQYQVGERYIVQADVFYKGESMAYGYVLPGAMQQYGLVGPEILHGDDGSYLIPMREETGYLQAALAEPWACVVAAYRIQRRSGLKKSGVALVYGASGTAGTEFQLESAFTADAFPRMVVTTGTSAELRGRLQDLCTRNGAEFAWKERVDLENVRATVQSMSESKGFDDIIVLGTARAEDLRLLGEMLGKGGVLNVVGSQPIPDEVEIDIGRIHYDNLSFVGTSTTDVSKGYAVHRSAELVAGGSSWFIGAAGPMGQMHVQRAVELQAAPGRILCTDIDDGRMEMLRLRVEKTARERGIDIRFENPSKLQPGELEKLIADYTGGKGFDDVVTLVPVSALIAQAAFHVANGGVMNIFAGIPRGTKAMLPLSDVFTRGVRYIGSSGSALEDLVDTLHLSEEDKLKTANSAAAIGGMNAMREGIAAVKEGRFPGKTVIFPQFPDFPLIPVSDLKDVMPEVYALLKDGIFWTREAEDEFLRQMLSRTHGDGGSDLSGPAPANPTGGTLAGKCALITGAAQGLGKALAERLAREGARVALVDLNRDGVSATAAEIAGGTGAQTIALQADITDEEQVGRAFDAAVREFGKLDIVVSNAGILIAGEIENFDVGKWRKVIDVNLVGYMVVAKAAAKAMIPRKSGVIIQINSKSGKKGSFRNSAYAASKFGGVGLTQSLALELAPHNIRVNAICPGNLLDSPLWVDSLYEQYSQTQNLTKEEVRAKYEGQVPLGRGCSYDDVANVMVFLAGEQSSYMTGQAINVTGGQQMD